MPTEALAGPSAMGRAAIPGDDLELGYRWAPIWADLLRAGGGLGLALLPLVLLTPPWPVALGLVALGAVFALFLLQTWRRQHSLIRLSEEGIAVTGATERALAWRDLDRLRLRWFGPRRQGGGGWLDLELSGRGQRIAVTSALDGFELVLDRALAAAERNGVALEPVTRANLEAALGAAPGPVRRR